MVDCTEFSRILALSQRKSHGACLSGPEYLEGRVTEYLLNRLSKHGISAVRQHVSRTRECGGCFASHKVEFTVLLWDASGHGAC